MDSRVQSMVVMSSYGMVGGFLLGGASMAFGTSSNALARGASLGLYAGILFGGYAILSYEARKHFRPDGKEDYYPDSEGPYEVHPSSFIKNPLFYSNLITFQF